MDELRILYGDGLDIAPNFRVRNPTLGEIAAYGEQRYASEVAAYVIRPYDAAVLLDDMGLDYRNITDYDMFLMIARTMIPKPTLLTPDVALSEMELGVNPQNDEPILYHPSKHLMIDRAIYQQVVDYIRAIHFISARIEYDVANGAARAFYLDRMRRKLKKNKSKPFEPQYPQIISALVNNCNFKYDYTTVWNLRVGQMWDAFYRINRLQNYQNTMLGVYTGNVDASKLDKDALSWFERIDVNERRKQDTSQALSTTL